MNKPWLLLLALCCITLFSGCGRTLPTPAERFQRATQHAGTNSSLQQQIYRTETFSLLAYETPLQNCRNQDVHVYIEGDGLAWITSSRISANPTPINPVALKLATQDPAVCRVYLARPCQYLTGHNCTKKYWTSHRFSQEVIDSYHEVCNTIKNQYDVASFTLFGYSGGGAVATLLAAQRDDVLRLVTVAGTIDTEQWSRSHSLTPLYGSLNPADFAEKLADIEQLHLIGASDSIINSSVFAAYHQRFDTNKKPASRIFSGFDHNCCWENAWPAILQDLQ